MQEPQPPEPRYTAWHFFLAYCLQYLVDPSRLEVHVFEKLGVLPLEADVLILRKVADLTGAARLPDFDFLWPYLGHYTVLEYKSPDDVLTPEDLDRLRTYGLLCKHKYGVKWERKVRLLLLYSHVQADFFVTCEQNELPFVKGEEPGVHLCRQPAMQIVALNLVSVGQRIPRSVINLLSARHRQFTREAPAEAPLSDLAQYLLHVILSSQEIRKIMDPAKLKGLPELTQDIEVLKERFLSRLTPEERLRGISTQERLHGIPPEERILGLTPEELDRLRALLNQRKN
jgi:hypothetical protein